MKTGQSHAEVVQTIALHLMDLGSEELIVEYERANLFGTLKSVGDRMYVIESEDE